MNTGKHEFGPVISANYRFKVPEYQRNYSWDIPQVEDLWQDLTEDLDKTHFFGTFLLQKGDGERRRDTVYDIIDGQQRLTSILILFSELAKVLRQSQEGGLAEEITRNYLVEGGRYNLTLMGSDEEFFKDYILEGILDESGEGYRPVGPGDQEIDTPSRRRLLDAKRYFRNKLDGIGLGDPQAQSDQYAVRLLEKIEGMDLMVYKVENRADAIRVFLAVNDRGKDLSKLEKTKSYLMHRLYLSVSEDEEDLLRSKVERVQRNFGNIYEHIEAITSTEFGGALGEDRVQQYHFIIWNNDWTTSRDSRYYTEHLEHLKRLFGAERSSSDRTSTITDYTDGLERGFQALREILQPKTLESELLRNRTRRLLTIGRIANFYPLLMAAWMKYREGSIGVDALVKLLERIETFVVRVYLIRQRPANTGRTKAYRLARSYHQGDRDISQVAGIINEYIEQYAADDELREVLSESDVYSYFAQANRLKDLRVLLYAYESVLENKLEGISMNIEGVVNNPDQKFSIEHIWPQDPSNLNLTEDTLAKYPDQMHRLGNLALMTGGWNSGEQNRPYPEKRRRYLDSRIRMLNEVARKHDQWGYAKIAEREEAMVDVILSKWSG